VKQAAPEGKTILWVNCDETSIGYAFPRLRGNVVYGLPQKSGHRKRHPEERDARIHHISDVLV